jgi:hypothetical protein
MPSTLRMAPLMTGARNTAAVDFALAPSTPVTGLDAMHRDSLGGGIRRSYNQFCDNLSARVWDNPNGRRLSFDIHGKPGVAVEIPLR